MSAPEDLVRTVNNFPKDGEVYRDLSGLMADPGTFSKICDVFTGMFDREIYDSIVFTGGFSGVLAGVISAKMGKPVIMAGYKGDIPGEVMEEDADGKTVVLPKDSVKQGMKVVIFCDVLDTGKASAALARLVEKAGGEVIRFGYIAEIAEGGARKSKIIRRYPFEAFMEI